MSQSHGCSCLHLPAVTASHLQHQVGTLCHNDTSDMKDCTTRTDTSIKRNLCRGAAVMHALTAKMKKCDFYFCGCLFKHSNKAKHQASSCVLWPFVCVKVTTSESVRAAEVTLYINGYYRKKFPATHIAVTNDSNVVVGSSRFKYQWKSHCTVRAG